MILKIYYICVYMNEYMWMPARCSLTLLLHVYACIYTCMYVHEWIYVHDIIDMMYI